MLVGQKIGPFIVDKELGSGAMGAVYRGRHAETGRKVAIKIIAAGLASNNNALARFKRETAILKQLDHPHIVKLLASGKMQGTPFYVMEYIEGESLDRVMERRGRITWEELITLGQQLCAALQHAHELGIIHRDLKPSNLMVLKDGSIKLTDFGIAKDIDVTALTGANSTVGTAAYMSPEQCRGSREITNKSDLYSMGVMFFELLTGRKPFIAETVMEMFMQHTQGKHPRPSRLVLELPIALDNLICDLLQKEPDKRPFNAEAVSRLLGVVKEKWETQQSAAVTRAKKRRADRSATEAPLDEEDKEIARTLLGKKKKTKAEPFYQQNWFTLSAVGGVLIALAAVIYTVFFMAPSADSLYVEAERMVKNKDIPYRDRREPLAKFLEYHPNHTKKSQIQLWLDQVERDECERTMHNRRGAMKAAGDQEPIARRALDHEDKGELREAKKEWDSLVKLKDSDDPEQRPWGLVAAKYLTELKEVESLYADLRSRIANEAVLKSESEGDSRAEKFALKAVREEEKRDLAKARANWKELQSHAKSDESIANQRRWFLLATHRLDELDRSASIPDAKKT